MNQLYLFEVCKKNKNHLLLAIKRIVGIKHL